jgi:hypothetical protein
MRTTAASLALCAIEQPHLAKKSPFARAGPGRAAPAGRPRCPRIGQQTTPKLTLLGKSRWFSSKDIEVNVTRGTTSVLLAFSGCIQDPFSARFGLTQQSQNSLYAGAE